MNLTRLSAPRPGTLRAASRHTLPMAAAALGLLCIAAGPTVADATGPETALSLVRSVVVDGTSAITDARATYGGSQVDGESVFNDIFHRHFATALIGQKLLGSYWDSSNVAERRQFMDAFGTYLADELVAKFPTGTFTFFDDVESRDDADAGPIVVVKSVFAAENSSTAVEWHLTDVAGEPKVVDIVIRGKSLMSERGREYAEFLGQNDGSIPALIAFLAD